jgi:hypothetical protein
MILLVKFYHYILALAYLHYEKLNGVHLCYFRGKVRAAVEKGSDYTKSIVEIFSGKKRY